ncbi:MAG: HAD hydrolase family protein [Nitrospirae bacterium]|jgi:soluble P-type ATPase|nr:HAD hydrolase family protein [Nitrospirota bacterium]
MISVEIPGNIRLDIDHFVSDFSGTLSEDGVLLSGVREKLNELAEKVHVHVLTSDTFGKAHKELEGIKCTVHILDGPDHTGQKERYVLSLGAEKVVAIGNGNNDARMLKAAGIGVVVCLKEGCSVEALTAAKIFVMSPMDAVDLLLQPKRLIATLRR